MDLSDKDDCMDACPRNHVMWDDLDGEKAYHSDISKKGVGYMVATDKKISVVDSGCEVDNISCISKADGSNVTVSGHIGGGDLKNLTGSSDSVNSFTPTGSVKSSDVQSLKYNSTGSACVVECSSQLEGSRQYAKAGDSSEKSDPSETSSIRDEHAGAFLPKASMSSGQGMDKRSDDQTIVAVSCGLEHNEHIEMKEPSNVKGLPLPCLVAQVVKEVELVDVRLCDICGDVGREYMLALCSRCNDGAEHTYCMRFKMDKLPESYWVCEDCNEIENPRKRLVDFEEETDEICDHVISSSVISSSNGTGRTKLDRTSSFSSLGKRPGPNSLMSPKVKKRAEAIDVRGPGSSGTYIKPVVLTDSNLKSKQTIVRPATESSGGCSPHKFSEKALPIVTDTQYKGRQIKGSGLEVHSQHDAGSRGMHFAEKSSIATAKREHVLRKLRRSESLWISSPACPIPSSPKKNLSTENKTPGIGIKRKTTQRSYSFELKSTHPVSPLGSPSLSKGVLDKEASLVVEARLPFVSRNDHRSTISSHSAASNTANKRARNILRNTDVSGLEVKIPRSDRVAVRRSINAVHSSNGHTSLKSDRKTGDFDVQKVQKLTDLSKNAVKSSISHTSLKADSDVEIKNVPKLANLSKSAVKSSNGHGSLKADKNIGAVDVKNVRKLADLSKNALKSAKSHSNLKPDKKTGDVDVKNVQKLPDSKNAVKSPNRHTGLQPDKKSGDVDVKNVTKLTCLSKNAGKNANCHASFKPDNKIGDVDVKNVPKLANLSDNTVQSSNGCCSFEPDRKSDSVDVKNVSKLTEVSNTAVVSSNGYSALKPGRKTYDVEIHPKLTEISSNLSNGSTGVKFDIKADVDVKNVPCVLDTQSGSKTNVQVDRLSLNSTILSPSSHPTPDSVWRGGFQIEKLKKHPLHCHGLQAHLSSSASPKVSELVSKWPSEIVLKEVCKKDIWPNQFQKYGTSEKDIAVYFFAEDLKSYSIYQTLLNGLLGDSLALQSDLNGVELLVFPSHCLPQRSQRWNNLFYLWGVLKAKHSSSMDKNVCAAGYPKGIHNHEPESVLSCQQPTLRHQNGSISGAASLPASALGCGATDRKDLYSADSVMSSHEEVNDDSAAKILAGDMLDLNVINHDLEPRKMTDQSSGKSELAADEGTAFLNKIVSTDSREYETTARLTLPSHDSSSPLDILLDAVKMVQDSKTGHSSLLLNSNPSSHCRVINMQVDLEIDQPIKDPLNLEEVSSSHGRVNDIQVDLDMDQPKQDLLNLEEGTCSHGRVIDMQVDLNMDQLKKDPLNLEEGPSSHGRLIEMQADLDMDQPKQDPLNLEEGSSSHGRVIDMHIDLNMDQLKKDPVNLEEGSSSHGRLIEMQADLDMDQPKKNPLNLEEGSSSHGRVMDMLVDLDMDQPKKNPLNLEEGSSSHGRVIDMQVDLDMDQPKKDPLNLEEGCYSYERVNDIQIDLEMDPLNLEYSLKTRREQPENNGELNLLLTLANKIDDHVEFPGNSGDALDGGVSHSVVDDKLSLDLSLALPLEYEQLVLTLEDSGLPEKNDVDTSLQLFGRW